MPKTLEALTKRIMKLEKTIAGYFSSKPKRSSKSKKRKSVKAVVKRASTSRKKAGRRKVA